MDAFFLSLVTIGIAEVGDRSLFLALFFGLRYQRPWPIFAGMTLGLLANQAISAFVGMWLFQFLQADWHAWIVGIAFIIMSVWVLIPEAEDEFKTDISGGQLFLAAAMGFFILEMADKSQLVIVTLAGSYQSFWPVVLGGTLGILAVTTPVLWLGYKFAHKIPVRAMKWLAFSLFLLLGIWVLLGAAEMLNSSTNLDQVLTN